MASILNVELVYIILKGITQFSYITCEDKLGKVKEKASMLQLWTWRGDVTLTCDKIKIKDFEQWATGHDTAGEGPADYTIKTVN